MDCAQKAFDTTWGLKASGSSRAGLMQKLANAMVENRDELCALEALDNGGFFLDLLFAR